MLRTRPGKFALIAVLAATVMQPANAGTLSAILNGKSHHVSASRDWNEDNFGFGLQYDFESGSRWIPSLTANGFRDSDNEPSYMVGASLHRRLIMSEQLSGFYLDAGLTLFLMTREDVRNNQPFPGILPTLSFGNHHIGLNLTYFPMSGVRTITNLDLIDPDMKGVFYMQMKINIKSIFPD
jgi:hypothetical protein